MHTSFNRISVVGLGYIGLPTAATIATRGIEVIGVDINKSAVERINQGAAHFSEPDLDILLQSAVMTGKLKAVTEPQEADAFLIAVPTPFLADKSADLSYVEVAARAVAKVIKRGDLVILESTSPVGTTERLCEWMSEVRPDLVFPGHGVDLPDVNVAYCPERILPGRMVFELVENDRIIGGLTERCAEKAKALYEIFVRGRLLTTRAATAELVKLIENAYRDVNIAFSNEISILCDKLKLDPWEAIALANHHPRVNILSPGPGVGGHCIAVDPWFLISALPEHTPLMRAARQVNDGKPHVVLDKVRRQMEKFRHPVVACLGLAYKPDVDDLRESPALEIVRDLANEEDAEFIVVEPNIKALPKSLQDLDNVSFASVDDAIENADIIVLLVGHKQFANVSRRDLQERVIIDTCGGWQR